MKQPETVSELYPSKWLKAADLTRPVTVAIAAVGFEDVYNPQAGETVTKLIVTFEKCQKRLIANKTQCEAIWQITGTERFADWPGHSVTVGPGRTHNGKATVVISRAAANPTAMADEPMTQQQAILTMSDEPSHYTQE